jgi:uncharacterized protein with PQ loop repeat
MYSTTNEEELKKDMFYLLSLSFSFLSQENKNFASKKFKKISAFSVKIFHFFLTFVCFKAKYCSLLFLSAFLVKSKTP